MSRKICLVEGCGTYVTKGLRVCDTHAHVQALQAEIERLRSSHPDGAWQTLRHPDMRRLFRIVAELDARAQPMKGANTQVTARSRGHNLDDGIVTLRGDQVAIPGYAVASYADSGRLGAALSQVKECADRIEGIADVKAQKRRDLRKRCGRRECDGKNRRQDPESRFCAYCGRQFEEAA